MFLFVVCDFWKNAGTEKFKCNFRIDRYITAVVTVALIHPVWSFLPLIPVGDHINVHVMGLCQGLWAGVKGGRGLGGG